jgi:hypothetical protein
MAISFLLNITVSNTVKNKNLLGVNMFSPWSNLMYYVMFNTGLLFLSQNTYTERPTPPLTDKDNV